MEPKVIDFKNLEHDIENFRPRFFDTYVLPAFVMLYAVKSKGMKRNFRRMLFTSGVYMAYRNYSEYKKAYENIKRIASTQ